MSDEEKVNTTEDQANSEVANPEQENNNEGEKEEGEKEEGEKEEGEQSSDDEDAASPSEPEGSGERNIAYAHIAHDGKEIEVVLNDGKATETQYHVKFADGSTGHVDKEWLDERLAAE